MVSGGGGGSTSTQESAPYFTLGYGGVQKLAKRLSDIFQPMLGGDLTSPTARMLSGQAYRAGEKEAGLAGVQLEKTSGLSEPARAKAAKDIQMGAVKSAAGVPIQVWNKALDQLNSFLQPAGQGSRGTSLSMQGQGGVCCYIFCTADEDEDLLFYVRRYKDEHYDLDSMVAQGYKRLALLLVPLMKRSRVFKQVVKWGMVRPMEYFARAYYEENHLLKIILYPLTRVYVGMYALIGHLYGLKEWDRYWRLG
jgi:hypothetical protein